MMGSGSPVTEEAINYLNANGQKVGVLKVRMYRPWSAKHFLAALPASCKTISVLDRTKESGALAEPLFLDVVATLAEMEMEDRSLPKRFVVGGRYGLGSKDFTPGMAIAVFDNMRAASPKKRFTVGITDDLTNLSLPVPFEPDCVPKGTRQALFWGMGSDGTVGANKEAIKMIADNTPMNAQAYFGAPGKKHALSWSLNRPSNLTSAAKKTCTRKKACPLHACPPVCPPLGDIRDTKAQKAHD